jgi:hypothetical protein
MLKRIGAVAGWLTLGFAASGFSRPLQGAGQIGGFPQWLWALIILALAAVVALVVGWWLVGMQERGKAVPPEAEVATVDDLTRIEGIGPKISSLLQEAGISSFAQLAGTSVDRLQKIIADAKLTALADPATWPAQAKLAAEGEWERLDALQEELKGGRR